MTSLCISVGLPWAPAGLSSRPGDEPCAAAVRGEAERPADDDEDTVLEADEVPEVDDQPGDPGDQAAEPQPLDVGDRGGAADGREVPLVAVTERRCVARAEPSANDPCRVAALLHRDRCDS